MWISSKVDLPGGQYDSLPLSSTWSQLNHKSVCLVKIVDPNSTKLKQRDQNRKNDCHEFGPTVPEWDLCRSINRSRNIFVKS